jgi:transposase InsO family protein
MPHRALSHSYGSRAHDPVWDDAKRSPDLLTLHRAIVNAMIAMPLTYLNVGKSPAPSYSGLSTPFQPLDPDVLNASIPAFFIGATATGSGWRATSGERVAAFSCSGVRRWPLRGGFPAGQAARRYFHPSGSNSTSKITAIR